MRNITFLFSCLLSFGMAWAEGGETCGSATVITCIPYTDSGNTGDNINNYDYACPNTSNSFDVVYRYTPPVAQTIGWRLCASLYNTKIYIFENSCIHGIPIVCNDDFPFCGIANTGSLVNATLNAGVDYYIIIDGASGQEGAYTLVADFVACIPDFVLSPPGLVTGNTCGASNSCSLRPSEDQMVELNVPVAGNYSFSLCNSNPAWNSYMYVTRGCCGGVIAENDNGGCTSSGLLSYIECVYLEACQYHVIIEGTVAGNCGSWTLNVTQHTCFPEYYLYEPGTLSGTTCGGCSECNLQPSPDAVVQITLPQTGNYTFSFCTGDSANTWEMVASLRSQCCGGTLFGDDQGSCDAVVPGGSAIIPCVSITGGVTYYLQIEGATVSDCGPWTLTVIPGGAELSLDVPGTISGTTIGARNHCDFFPGQDKIVQLNVAVGGVYSLSLCETVSPGAWDSYLFLSTSCCDPTAVIASNDNGCGPPNSNLSRMDCRFLDSGTYYAIVDGTDTADWTLAVTACPCEPYGTLQAPGTISGNTCGYDMGCEPFVGDFQDIAVRIPWDGQYTFSFCDPDPDNWDSEFGITADCCSDNFFAYSDNGCEYLNGHGRRACVALVRGTYYVVIGPRQSQCGSWTLNVTACTAAATVDSLVILALPPNIQLSWFSFGGEVNYNIYRGDSANFAITPANLIGATTASSYVDSGAINTAQLAYYYAVTATTP